MMKEAYALAAFVLIFFAGTMFYVGWHEQGAEIARFKSTKRTIMVARERGNKEELAAMAHKIVEANRWLDEKLYRRDTGIGKFMFPAELDTLTHIR